MAHGLSILNASGYAQIDQDYSNYVVLSSGTGTTATRYTKPTTDPNAILMVSTADTTGHLFSMDVVSPGTILPDNEWGVYMQKSTGSAWTTYVTFKYLWLLPSRLVAESTETYGLKVFRADGSLAFTSRQEPLNIAAGWIPYNAYSGNETLNLPASTKTRYVSLSALKIFYSVGYCIPDGGGCWVAHNQLMVKFVSNSSLNLAMTEQETPQTASNPDPGFITSPASTQFRHILVGEF